ncbi:hypothetical protein CC79DRAFT_1377871 [Sarocladium strictum]
MKFEASSILAALYATAALAAPQVNMPIREKKTSLELVGDGSPRQAYLYKQVTDPHSCGESDKTCSIGKSEGESLTVGVTGGITSPWFNAGFSVSKSYTTGQTASCNAGGDEFDAHTVCVWARIAHTGYEVQAWKHWPDRDPTDGEKSGDPDFMWSPNSNKGHGFVCAHDDECQSLGDEWWGEMSKGDKLWEAVSNKGGPQDFVWGNDPENRWN